MNNEKIYTYMIDNRLNLEKAMKDYTNYIYAIIRNDYSNFVDEDIEEIVLDVFLTLWNNQNKLDINKKMSSYIAGITKNLIKKKYRQVKINENIEDYEQELIDFRNIEISFIQREKNTIINNELNSLKIQDKDIFIKYYYYEKSIKEIANYYNISESKVKSKLFRIRKRLHRILKKRGYISNEK